MEDCVHYLSQLMWVLGNMFWALGNIFVDYYDVSSNPLPPTVIDILFLGRQCYRIIYDYPRCPSSYEMVCFLDFICCLLKDYYFVFGMNSYDLPGCVSWVTVYKYETVYRIFWYGLSLVFQDLCGPDDPGTSGSNSRTPNKLLVFLLTLFKIDYPDFANVSQRVISELLRWTYWIPHNKLKLWGILLWIQKEYPIMKKRACYTR